MRFDTKIAVIVREDLATWQKLNVACFPAGGLAGAYPELAGERYRDASASVYGPLIRQPVCFRMRRMWSRWTSSSL